MAAVVSDWGPNPQVRVLFLPLCFFERRGGGLSDTSGSGALVYFQYYQIIVLHVTSQTYAHFVAIIIRHIGLDNGYS